jgi:hypothetical protein
MDQRTQRCSPLSGRNGQKHQFYICVGSEWWTTRCHGDNTYIFGGSGECRSSTCGVGEKGCYTAYERNASITVVERDVESFTDAVSALYETEMGWE